MNFARTLNESILFLEKYLGAPAGSSQFLLYLGVFLGCTAIVGLICNRWIGASTRGFIGTTIGLLLPLFAFAYLYMGLPELLAQHTTDTQMLANTQMLLSVLGALLILAILSPFFLGTGFIKGIIVFAITLSIAITAVKFTKELSQKYAVFSKEFHEKFE